ncbi:MAG: TfoX/Sxy family protein [Bosea sp.]|nr:TfoX/Sxy family protein [Bosea sp. (in: a-proteobacteria)]
MTNRKAEPEARPIAAMRGIGPKSAIWLTEIGVATEADLRALGAIEAYRRLKHRDPRGVTLNMLWGLHAALEDMPWTAIDRETKDRLLAELGDAGL